MFTCLYDVLAMPCLDLYVFMPILPCYRVRSILSHAYMFGFSFFHVQVLGFTCLHACSYAYIPRSMSSHAYARIHILPCLCARIYMFTCMFLCVQGQILVFTCLCAWIYILYVLYAIFHMFVRFMPCLCAQTQAMFVMPCAIVTLLLLCFSFCLLAYWLGPNLDPMVFVIILYLGPHQRVWITLFLGYGGPF